MVFTVEDYAITGPKHVFERTDGQPLHEDATLFLVYMNSWSEKKAAIYYSQCLMERYHRLDRMPHDVVIMHVGTSALGNGHGYSAFRANGIGPKYRVKRRDGQPMKDIPYFIFEIDTDACAKHALKKFAMEVMNQSPRFAKSLLDLVVNETWKGFGYGLLENSEKNL